MIVMLKTVQLADKRSFKLDVLHVLLASKELAQQHICKLSHHYSDDF